MWLTSQPAATFKHSRENYELNIWSNMSEVVENLLQTKIHFLLMQCGTIDKIHGYAKCTQTNLLILTKTYKKKFGPSQITESISRKMFYYYPFIATMERSKQF
jgi:hypothetical protein